MEARLAPSSQQVEATLTPEAYRDAVHFRDEMKALAQSSWHPAGLVSDLPEHNDYVTLNIGERSVVVQNFRGQLKAFENVCSHRGSQIRCERKGSGPLRCPYHGWTFDAEGLPSGIPHRDTFAKLDEAQLASLRLRTWKVEAVGKFLFVASNEPAQDLRGELGPFYEQLLEISSALGREVDRSEMTIRANWKVAVENTLESYHVDLVHPDSFKRLGTSGDDFEFARRHSSWRTEVSPAFLASWKKIEKPLRGRPLAFDGYRHLFLFPTLTVASSFGASFSVQTFEPLEVGLTRFTTRIFLSELQSGSAVGKAALDLLADSVISFNRQVFEEDRVITEQVQRGLATAERFGPLSLLERRVAEFQRACAALIPRGSEAPNSGSGE